MYLLGWDSTVPELNPSLNLERFISGVWQEYRGLGTLDGMAHTANIVYWFYSTAASLFLPLNLVRYTLLFILYCLGGLGAYVLVNSIFHSLIKDKTTFRNWATLLSALLYQSNGMTLQMFYLPLEVFAVHFAVLPWGLWASKKYLEQPTAKNMLLVAIINILGLSQAHVPSVFITYALCQLFLCVCWFLKRRNKASIQILFSISCTFLAINALWGFPYIVSALQKSSVIADSKINQFSTADIFYRNYAWGTLYRVVTKGSFNFDYQDWDMETKQYSNMMPEWYKHYSSPLYQIITILFFCISCVGAVSLFKKYKSNYSSWWLILSWFFLLSMLTVADPILGTISYILRTFVPYFGDIFRFTFTKFSQAYVLFESILFGFGLLYLYSLLQHKTNINGNLYKKIFISVVILCLLIISMPAWSKNFFYNRLYVKVPKEYFHLQDFLQTKPKHATILILPSPSFYGWTNNEWGYRGSGFLWQMIPQSMIDRAFDAWSSENESVYSQLNYALRTNQPELLDLLLEKYSIQYILLDTSIIVPSEYEQTRRIPEINEWLDNSDLIRQTWAEGSLILYENKTLLSSVSVPTNIHTVTDTHTLRRQQFDPVYSELNNYIYDTSSVSFPFVTFSQEELNLLPTSSLRTDISSIHFPPLLEHISGFNSETKISLNDELLRLQFTPILPNLSGKNLPTFSTNIPLATTSALLTINNQPLSVATASSKTETIVLDKQELDIVAFSALPFDERNLLTTFKTSKPQSCWTDSNKNASVSSENIQNAYVLSATNATACLLTEIQNLYADANPILVQVDITFDSKSAPVVCMLDTLNNNCVGSVNTQDNKITLSSTLAANKKYTLQIKTPYVRADEENVIRITSLDLKTYRFIDQKTVPVTELWESIDTFYSSFENSNISTILNVPLQQTSFFNNYTSEGFFNCEPNKIGTFSKNANEYISTKGAIVCELFNLSFMRSSLEYLIDIPTIVTNGSGAKMSLTNNKTEKLTEVSIPESTTKHITVLPKSQSENNFQLQVNIPSYGPEVNTVLLEDIQFSTIPAKWLSHIYTGNKDANNITFKKENITYDSILTFAKLVYTSNREEMLITLQQSYDPGWIAFSTNNPLMLFKHVNYNGWANSWFVPGNQQHQTIVIIYWPQLLSFIGYILLLLLMITLLWSTFNEKNSKNTINLYQNVKNRLTGT